MRIEGQFTGMRHRGPDRRGAELAKIHVLAKQAGLDRETYEAMLGSVAGVTSARDLDGAGRRQVIVHLMRTLGIQRTHHAGAPRTIDERPMLRRIEALLADAGRPWAYAEAVARRVAKRERLEFCSDGDLRAVIAALATDAKRHPRGADA